MYRSWSEGCDGYLRCTGLGARVVGGTWGVQVLEQGMWGAHGVYRSSSKGCEGYMGCTGSATRDVGSVQVLQQGVGARHVRVPAPAIFPHTLCPRPSSPLLAPAPVPQHPLLQVWSICPAAWDVTAARDVRGTCSAQLLVALLRTSNISPRLIGRYSKNTRCRRKV